MNIGFDAKRFFHNRTGLGNYSRDLVRILAHYFPQNKYVLYNPKPKKIDRIPLDGKTIVEKLPNKGIYNLFPFLWRGWKVTEDFKKEEITIFHGLSGELPYGISSTGVKTVVTIHDLIFIRFPELYTYFDRKVHFQKMKYAAINADVVIAISEQTKRDIIDFLGISGDKVKVIYQGCASVFKESIEMEVLKKVANEYHLPSSFILNVGTIESRKNILSVIKVMKDVPVPLVIIGKKTSYYTTLSTYIAQHNLSDKVIFLENVTLADLAAIYRLATVFVYPSLFEGFGIPIIEALYSKVSVITSTGSCFSEAGGEDSIYVTPNDEQQMKDAILSVLNDGVKREQMITKGLEYAQRFNDEQIAEDYMGVYKSLIAKT